MLVEHSYAISTEPYYYRQQQFIRAHNNDEFTALHEAAVASRTDVVEYICRSSSAVDELILKKDADGGTALHYAKNREIAKLLVNSVLRKNKKSLLLSVDDNQWTALHSAAESGETDVVEYLCSLSLADELILKDDANGWTALHYAYNREIAKMLVDSVLPKNKKSFLLSVDKCKRTGLHTAAGSGKTGVVEYFCSLSIANDELILKKDANSWTALHYAKNRTVAKLLVQSVSRANPKGFILSIDKNQCTALHTAAKSGKTDVVKYLCSLSRIRAELIQKKDNHSRTALHHAESKEIAKLLVDSVRPEHKKEFLLSVSSTQKTALHFAAGRGRTDVVEYLCSLPIAKKELILRKDANGWTALHYAENRAVAEVLVDSVLPKNKKGFLLSGDKNQRTALHTATACGRTDVVEYLCSLSRDDNELILKKDAEGWTALHSAQSGKIARLLVKSVLPENVDTFVLSVATTQNITALHVAAGSGDTDVVEYLCNLPLANDELLLMKNFIGWTALHFAQNGKIAKLLVEKVLLENQRNFILCASKGEFTALHIAAMYRKTQVVEYLCSLPKPFAELSVELIFRQDFLKSTAMHYATNKEIVSCMLKNLQSDEIDKLLRCANNEGNTPILLFVRFGLYESLEEVLKDIDGNKDLDMKTYLKHRNSAGQNIFHLAALSLPLDSVYNVLQNYVWLLEIKEMMYPDVYGNTPIHYVAARYASKILADLMLHLPLPMRQELVNLPNSQLIDCRKIIYQSAFSESFYMKKVLADNNYESLVSVSKYFSLYTLDCEKYSDLEKFYKYDEKTAKVLKYCLNEYSLRDFAYTTSQNLSLATVFKQNIQPKYSVSNIYI